jgi:DNA-binding CsgD family transcriptional regulator
MDRTRQRVVERVARAAEAPGGAAALYSRVIAELARALGFDGVCWHISDPLSAIPVRGGGVGHPPGDFARSLEFHRDDVLRFHTLARRARPVGAIGLETHGRPRESPRYREMIEPEGGRDELRVAFADRFGVWGTHALVSRRAFTPAETQLVADTVPAITRGLRLAHAQTATAAEDVPPLVVIDDARDRVVGGDARARARLDELGATGTWSVLAALARLRGPQRPAAARFRDAGGRWVSVDASPLDDDPAGSVALVLKPAPRSSVLDGLLRAYGLSEREREIVRHAIRGETNREIATRLHLSPWTVQDHLKMAFEKTGVRSRGALAALAITDARD